MRPFLLGALCATVVWHVAGSIALYIGMRDI